MYSVRVSNGTNHSTEPCSAFVLMLEGKCHLMNSNSKMDRGRMLLQRGQAKICIRFTAHFKTFVQVYGTESQNLYQEQYLLA